GPAQWRRRSNNVRGKSASLVGSPPRDSDCLDSRIHAEKYVVDISGRRILRESRDVDPAASLPLHLQLHAGLVFRPPGLGWLTRAVLEWRRTTLGTPRTVSAASAMPDSRLGSCLGRSRGLFNLDRLSAPDAALGRL